MPMSRQGATIGGLVERNRILQPAHPSAVLESYRPHHVARCVVSGPSAVALIVHEWTYLSDNVVAVSLLPEDGPGAVALAVNERALLSHEELAVLKPADPTVPLGEAV